MAEVLTSPVTTTCDVTFPSILSLAITPGSEYPFLSVTMVASSTRLAEAGFDPINWIIGAISSTATTVVESDVVDVEVLEVVEGNVLEVVDDWVPVVVDDVAIEVGVLVEMGMHAVSRITATNKGKIRIEKTFL